MAREVLGREGNEHKCLCDPITNIFFPSWEAPSAWPSGGLRVCMAAWEAPRLRACVAAGGGGGGVSLRWWLLGRLCAWLCACVAPWKVLFVEGSVRAWQRGKLHMWLHGRWCVAAKESWLPVSALHSTTLASASQPHSPSDCHVLLPSSLRMPTQHLIPTGALELLVWHRL